MFVERIEFDLMKNTVKLLGNHVRFVFCWSVFQNLKLIVRTSPINKSSMKRKKLVFSIKTLIYPCLLGLQRKLQEVRRHVVSKNKLGIAGRRNSRKFH